MITYSRVNLADFSSDRGMSEDWSVFVFVFQCKELSSLLLPGLDLIRVDSAPMYFLRFGEVIVQSVVPAIIPV